jgi:hypothetical protein
MIQELIGRAREVVFDTDQWVSTEEYDAVCISSAYDCALSLAAAWRAIQKL